MEQPQDTQYGNPQQASAPAGSGGLAIAALVLGIVALVGSWVPILNNLCAIVGLVGAILGIIAIVTANRKNRKKGMAIAGTILSVVAIIVVFATQALYVSALDQVSQELENQGYSLTDQ